ncbi:MAG: acyl carrier protein [Desulfuromonadales bacterium]|nr:acyl carrier protein [Desulfuromonadales bacterium]
MKDQIRKFIVENFLFGDGQGLNEETSLLDSGIVDSTGILELIEFMGDYFSVTVEDEEMLPENLDSINNIFNYLTRKLSQGGAGSQTAVSGS